MRSVMFGDIVGRWYVDCESDPRWNGGGGSLTARKASEIPWEAKDHLEAKKKELGTEPPADCKWGFLKGKNL